MILLLTFYRFYISIGIGEVCGDAQGAAVSTGLDAGGLQQQWFPGRAISQSHHLFLTAASLYSAGCMRTQGRTPVKRSDY